MPRPEGRKEWRKDTGPEGPLASYKTVGLYQRDKKLNIITPPHTYVSSYTVLPTPVAQADQEWEANPSLFHSNAML